MSQKREYPEKPIIGVGILIQKNDNYLMIQRAANPDKGLWTVPGGLIEVGERAADAAVRESLEETGLIVNIRERIGVVDKIEYDEFGEVLYHFIILQYLASPIRGALSPMDDALDAVWVTREEFANYNITNSLKHFLNEIGLYPV